MRNILAFLAAVTLTVAVAGKYLGWYSVRSTLDTTGHRKVDLDFDTKKIGQDLERGAAGVHKALEKNNTLPSDNPTDKLDKPEPAPVTNNGKFELAPLPHAPANHPNGHPVSVEVPQVKGYQN